MIDSHLTPDPTAVSIITGFLGSGKTTLLRRLLRDPSLKDVAVIVNEFGEIGLDHQLMEAEGQHVALLESGCICCSLDGSLVETIENLYRQSRNGKVPYFRRILIETTGLADPAPVIHELFGQRANRFGIGVDRVITLVEAVNGWATLDRHDVAVRQVALANSILVTKPDLAKPGDVDKLISRLALINPCARIERVENGRIDPKELISSDYDFDDFDIRPRTSNPVAAQENGHAHHDCISTLSIRLMDPIAGDAFSEWLSQAIAAYGDDLLRVKGLLNIKGRQRPTVVHGVQRVFHPTVELSKWPDDDRSSRLVFILYDIEPGSLIRSLREALSLDDGAAEFNTSSPRFHAHDHP